MTVYDKTILEKTTKSSMTSTSSLKSFSQIVDGFRIPGKFSAESFRSAINYKPRPDDVFVVTYPKCGTNWAQYIIVLIFRRGVPAESGAKFWSSMPFLEVTGAEGAEKIPRPGVIKTHLPYHLMPRSDAAKYVYVTRNPKDCCVSYFHHMRNMPGHAFSGTFDEFFESFISGDIDCGDYFDHLLGWYAHRNDPNVLFITYEEMKEQPEKSVLKMASFVDDKLYAEPLRNDPAILQNIIKHSGFEDMKETVNEAITDLFGMSKEDILKSDLPETTKKMLLEKPKTAPQSEPAKPRNIEFVRKGIIGDWKNYFSDEQSKRLEEKFYERTRDTDLPKLWEKYM